MSARTREDSHRASLERLAQIVAEIGGAAGIDGVAQIGLDAAIEVTAARGGELRLARPDGHQERAAWRGDGPAGLDTVSEDLRAGSVSRGRLEVWGCDPDPERAAALRLVVLALAQSIENRRLERAAREQRRRGRRFAAAVEALRYPAGPGESVTLVLRGARELMDAEAACLLTGRGGLQVASYDGMDPLETEQAQALVPEQTREMLEAEGGWSGQTSAQTGLRERSLTRATIVPVGVRGSLGILVVLEQGSGARPEEDVQALCDFAVHAAAAMTASVLGQEVRELGAVDPLTRFFNGRYFRTRLEQETQRALRTQSSLSVAVMGLDGLSEVRAEGGDAAADDALERLSALIVPRLRAMDVGCRIGEDELAAILPMVGGLDAYKVGERLRQAIQADLGLGERWTLSAGVATFPDQAGTPEQLADCALTALEWARRHGGDRTFLYTHDVVRSLESERRRESGARDDEDTTLVTVSALASAVDARHPTTIGHAEGVAQVAAAIGADMGMEASHVEDLRVAGLLHDVGKIGISEEVLVKDGPLTEPEWEEMRRHPEMGHRMLSGTRLEIIRPWVLHHHERLDGTGYPEGLSGEEIPLEARILAVADAFDSMVHDRPYRPAVSVLQARAELERCAGTQFDPQVVAALSELISRGAPEVGGMGDLA